MKNSRRTRRARWTAALGMLAICVAPVSALVNVPVTVVMEYRSILPDLGLIKGR